MWSYFSMILNDFKWFCNNVSESICVSRNGISNPNFYFFTSNYIKVRRGKTFYFSAISLYIWRLSFHTIHTLLINKQVTFSLNAYIGPVWQYVTMSVCMYVCPLPMKLFSRRLAGLVLPKLRRLPCRLVWLTQVIIWCTLITFFPQQCV